MDTIIEPEKLLAIYSNSTEIVTQQTSGILLAEQPVTLHGDVCTLYTLFEKNAHSGLALCAESGFLTRLTQCMMHTEQVEPQDVEDFSKEYYNMLCGHIAVALFKETRIPVRFQIPIFVSGPYRPEGQQERMTLSFLSDQREAAHLIHFTDTTKQVG